MTRQSRTATIAKTLCAMIASLAIWASPTEATDAAPAASIPAGEESAKEALGASPRHGEFVSIPLAGAARPISAWIVYPEKKEKAAVVIVIHEVFGLTDWIRAVADRLAADGFIAIAPDLLTGRGPGGGNTDAFASRDDAIKAIRALTPEETATWLDAASDYGGKLPAASGRTASVGFCWGGAASFSWATTQTGLDAAVVYYGSSPDAGRLASVKAPVLGLYGADDARVNATIEPATVEMKRLGKRYEVELFEGAGHGFLRQQSGHEGANLKAAQAAWPRMLAFLRETTK